MSFLSWLLVFILVLVAAFVFLMVFAGVSIVNFINNIFKKNED